MLKSCKMFLCSATLQIIRQLMMFSFSTSAHLCLLAGIIRCLQQFVRPESSRHAGEPAAAWPGGERCGGPGPGSISGAVWQTAETLTGGEPGVFLSEPCRRPGAVNQAKSLMVHTTEQTMSSKDQRCISFSCFQYFITNQFLTSSDQSRKPVLEAIINKHRTRQKQERDKNGCEICSVRRVFYFAPALALAKGYPNSTAPQ